MKTRLAASSVIAAAVCAMPAALAQAPKLSDQIALLIDAASACDVAQTRYFHAAEPSSDLLRTDGRPIDANLAQEGQSSVLWTGRKFFAMGKTADSRTKVSAISIADIEAPGGWRRDGTKLVHSESGLECPASFTLDDEKSRRELTLLGVTAYDQRGRDVSCNYQIEGEASINIYASYYPDLSLQDHAAGAVAAIRQNFSIKGTLPVISIEMESKAEETNGERRPALSGAFDVGEFNGVPYKTAIWLAETHGWHVKTRATYAQSDFTSEMTAAVLFSVNYLNVDIKNRVEPTTKGAEV